MLFQYKLAVDFKNKSFAIVEATLLSELTHRKSFPYVYMNDFTAEHNKMFVANSVPEHFDIDALTIVDKEMQKVLRETIREYFDEDEGSLVGYLNEKLAAYGCNCIDDFAFDLGVDKKPISRNKSRKRKGSFVNEVIFDLDNGEPTPARQPHTKPKQEEQTGANHDHLCGEEFVERHGAELLKVLAEEPSEFEDYLVKQINEYFRIDVQREIREASLRKAAKDKKAADKKKREKQKLPKSIKFGDTNYIPICFLTPKLSKEFCQRVWDKFAVGIKAIPFNSESPRSNSTIVLPVETDKKIIRSVKLMAAALCRKNKGCKRVNDIKTKVTPIDAKKHTTLYEESLQRMSVKELQAEASILRQLIDEANNSNDESKLLKGVEAENKLELVGKQIDLIQAQ